MPLKLPKLDNRTYDDLMKEMIASIPKYTKEWTNFNPSDPGIAILELLGWITESFIYRTDIIPESSYLNFLKLIAGSGAIYDESDRDHQKILAEIAEITKGNKEADIMSMRAMAQDFLRSRYTLVTENDFKTLVLEMFSPEIRRVEVLSLPYMTEIVVIPETTDETIEKIKEILYKRRLIGAALDVKNTKYTNVSLGLTILCKSQASSNFFAQAVVYSTAPVDPKSNKVEDVIARNLFHYLDCISGGPDGRGWPLGRDLLIYEVFQAIEMEEVQGLVNVEKVEIFDPPGASFPLRVEGLIRLLSLKIVVKEEGSSYD